MCSTLGAVKATWHASSMRLALKPWRGFPRSPLSLWVTPRVKNHLISTTGPISYVFSGQLVQGNFVS
jgi:hypothetical protein